ncbi:hypothetical protein [Desulfobulbus sp.]|uniref:hypothetical protein n=1 Tax=Desulfobulbus sp. TaxID=895 RepID=UPI00286F20CD|nr:hypothetical protein [Desulfobulbus sp.]
MTKEADDRTAVLAQIRQVLDAVEADDLDTVYDYRATIVAMYAQAMAEFHFEEEQLEWLNELLAAVETDDLATCRQLLGQETNAQTLFLASQFVALMAGFFHHDELLTMAQAMGLEALLQAMDSDGE